MKIKCVGTEEAKSGRERVEEKEWKRTVEVDNHQNW